MKPLISYYGGKQRMASKIVPLLPEHTVYVEPFAGGAAVLFSKPWPNVSNTHHYREVLNDTCGNLFNLYKVARDNPEALHHKISFTAYSQEDYALSIEILSGDQGNAVDRAWAYYVNIMQSFANKRDGGWGTNVYSRNSAAAWNNKDFPSAISRLRSVYLANTDALRVIKQWDSPQTLFYCDPPYIGTSQGHYGGYGDQEFANLLNALNGVKGAYVLSCYEDCQSLLYGAVENFEFATKCSASGKGQVGKSRVTSAKASPDALGNRTRVERVYRRFNTVPWRPELEKLRQAGKYSCFARNPKEKSNPGKLL